MQLYDLGPVSWQKSQLIYHALPRLGQEGLILLRPATPYVCIGYHQDLMQEVDVAYCEAHDIPIFRREVGGGAVYLDGDQLFYQLVLHKDRPVANQSKASFYNALLAPVVNAYGRLGIPAQYKPVNDVITAHGRKISGNGAGEIGDYVILVGNLIVDFDYDTMVHVLKVPDEKYRDKVFKSMRENLSTMKRELERLPSWAEMRTVLTEEFAQVLGQLEPATLPKGIEAQAQALWTSQFSKPEWLYKKGRRSPERTVKIAAGTEIHNRVYKAPGGLIRGILETREGRVHSVSLSGDFFFYPPPKLTELEDALVGVPLEEIESAIANFYEVEGIDSPGVTPADLAQVLVGA
jgi:lipoate-protein ligase A